MAKQPKLGHIAPKPKKKPRFIDSHIEGLTLAWRFSTADRNGPFSWAALQPGDKFKQVLEKMHEFETKTLAQLQDCGCLIMETAILEKAAKERLQAIKMDDFDSLMSF